MPFCARHKQRRVQFDDVEAVLHVNAAMAAREQLREKGGTDGRRELWEETAAERGRDGRETRAARLLSAPRLLRSGRAQGARPQCSWPPPSYRRRRARPRRAHCARRARPLCARRARPLRARPLRADPRRA